MRETKLRVGVGILVALMVILTGVEGYAQSPKITLKWANFIAPAHPNQTYLNKVKEAVELRTNGQVKVEMFPGGSLVDGGACWMPAGWVLRILCS